MTPIQEHAITNAEQLLAQGRFEEADRASLQVLAREPANVDALLVHAVACMSLRRLDEAERAAQTALAANPRNLSVRYLIANVALLAGREAQALERLSQAFAEEYGTANRSGPWDAARLAVDAVARETPAVLEARRGVLQAFGGLLARSQPEPEPAALDALVASPLLGLSVGEFGGRFALATRVLGFGLTAEPAWNRRIVEGILLPWMRRAFARDRFDIALVIEHAIYQGYVKQTESEAHFRDCFALWKDGMREAGARFAAGLPPVRPRERGALPGVGFFVHNVTNLAHVQTLLETLEGHASLPEPRMEPFLFFHAGQPEAIERFRAAGVRIEPLTLPGRQPDLLASLARMRSRIAEEGIGTLTWISAALALPFAFGMRLAPRQVWWAMKYHALDLPEIDGRVTGGGPSEITKMIHGREWSVVPVAAAHWFAPELSAEAARVRASLGAAGVVYGSFGREEKLSDPAFLDAIVAILRDLPGALFLWTGRVQLPEIQRRFEEAGVAARTRFIGWVDTRLYAQVIDVFLDSFPFPCGFTLYEAMGAGKPVVLFAGPASANTGINALVEPLLRADRNSSEPARTAHEIFRPDVKTDLYLRRSDAAGYVEVAVQLGRDPVFRKRAGDASRAFVERLMADRAGAARILASHLLGRDETH
ncbi:hypothetical protein BWI17_08190 [Betaproteobacteria bacterium GR16-43]|nr:hypothetical protein BWI17_08190 [Betaproteobacteria bacterium GR16-43]